VVNTLLEICPDAHDGNDCRFYLRMRDKMNSVPFACYTSLGLYSVLSGVFRTLEGDPPPTEAFAVFFPMVRPIVRNFWLGCAARNKAAPYDQCQQHSPEGLACRDCVATHPYFDKDV